MGVYNKGRSPREFLVFNSARSVSSQPYAVHICLNSSIDETMTEHHFKIFPGQTIVINVTTVGQRYGAVPASVRAETDAGVIKPLQKIQNTDNKCTILEYTVRSSDRNVTIELSVEQQNNIPQAQNGQTKFTNC